MYAVLCDKVKEQGPKRINAQWSDGDNVLVHIEELTTMGGSKFEVGGNVWRVWYTEPVAGIKTYVRHFTTKCRAEYYFKEAIMFSGFLGIDDE